MSPLTSVSASRIAQRPDRSLVGANVFCGLRRTLRRVGWQTIVLAFVLLDITGLGFTLVAPVWLASWMTINVAALMLGALSWSEDRRLQRESAMARERVRAAERRNLEERQREAQRLRSLRGKSPRVR